MNLTYTAHSLLLALAGRVPAGTTPGLDRLLAEQDPGSTTEGVATFNAVPTAEQVRALEKLGLAVQPMQYVALANVAGPVSAMQAAVAQGVATDVYLDELARDRKPVCHAHRFTRKSRSESPRDPVVLTMV
jgi:hypothetical protein